ncbi:MAG: hypothetical protein ACI9XK_004876 [Granulosicoccus sp.]
MASLSLKQQRCGSVDEMSNGDDYPITGLKPSRI